MSLLKFSVIITEKMCDKNDKANVYLLVMHDVFQRCGHGNILESKEVSVRNALFNIFNKRENQH